MDKMWKNGRLRILILIFSFEKQQRLRFNETFDLSDGCGNRWTTPARFQARTHSDVSDLHSYSGYAATPPRSKRKRGVESLATAVG